MFNLFFVVDHHIPTEATPSYTSETTKGCTIGLQIILREFEEKGFVPLYFY